MFLIFKVQSPVSNSQRDFQKKTSSGSIHPFSEQYSAGKQLTGNIICCDLLPLKCIELDIKLTPFAQSTKIS